MHAHKQSILIAGLGNLLLSDDGVGIHAVHELAKQPMIGVTTADIGTAVFHAMHYLEHADRVLLIDAVKAGGNPGDIYLLDADDVREDGPATSIHTLGMRSLSRLMPAPHQCPPMTVLGVEPKSLEYGMKLSGPVKAALPKVIETVMRTVHCWTSPLQTKPTITMEPAPC
ncbi:MAG: hydrogenase maturation protease [Kiritimatiellae bacterium]|nr:hydrogenase maturation protease [Kiritimatiellia bacterium]